MEAAREKKSVEGSSRCRNKLKMASQPTFNDEKSTSTPPIASADPENAALSNARDQDVANAMVGEQRHAIDPAVEARVIRRIDLFLVPAMFCGYGLVYYDKVRRLFNARRIMLTFERPF